MEKNIKLPHNIIIEGREKINISGVLDVISFDEEEVTLESSEGVLVIKGDNLHAKKLNLENGELSLTGHIDSIEYNDRYVTGSFFSRLFG